MSSVALFGGSFDPPHIGHMEIVKKLKGLKFIDKIVVMPTFLNPFKESFSAPPKKRLEWLEKIFKEDPMVTVSDFEVRQQRKVPTIETVEELQKEYDDVYIAIGADNLKDLSKWHRFKDLSKKVKFIVFARGAEELPAGDFIPIPLNIPISSTALRKEIKKELLPVEAAAEIYNYYKEHNEKTHREHNLNLG